MNVAPDAVIEQLREIRAERRPASGDGFSHRLISRRMLEVYNSTGDHLPGLRRRYAVQPRLHASASTSHASASGRATSSASIRITTSSTASPRRRPTCGPASISMAHARGGVPELDARGAHDREHHGRLVSVERDFEPISGIPRQSAIPVNVRALRPEELAGIAPPIRDSPDVAPGRLDGRLARAAGAGRMTVRTAIVLAILATACFQVGIVLQKVGADRLPRLGLSVRQGSVYLAFIRSPIWLAGIAINTFGWVLVLKAIANAPVSIIQPVLGFGLALLALFSAVFLKERLSRLESGGLVLMVAGLVLLGVSAAHQDGGGAVSLAPLLAVSVVFAGGIGAALPLGRSGQVPLPVVLGFGAGILIGLAALYTKGLFLTLDAGLPLLAWLVFLPLMMAANICGLWVMQAGFQHGRALIVGAVSAVTTKVVAIVGGMTTLGEVLPDHRVFAVARVAGLVLILLGTVVLARFGGEQVAARLGTAGEDGQRVTTS